MSVVTILIIRFASGHFWYFGFTYEYALLRRFNEHRLSNYFSGESIVIILAAHRYSREPLSKTSACLQRGADETP
jgi:hypothetical protein